MKLQPWPCPSRRQPCVYRNEPGSRGMDVYGNDGPETGRGSALPAGLVGRAFHTTCSCAHGEGYFTVLAQY